MTLHLEIMEWAGVIKFHPRTDHEGPEVDRRIVLLLL